MPNEVGLKEALTRLAGGYSIDPEPALERVVRRNYARSVRVKAVLLTSGIMLLLTGSAVAGYRYWFEPSPQVLVEERAGELIEDDTRILDSYVAPEGVKFQLVTYRTTKWRCFDVTIETKYRQVGSGRGCGGFEEQAALLQGSSLDVMSEAGVDVDGHRFAIVIGVAGPDVRKVRLHHSDGTTRLTGVHTDARVWFAVGSPSRQVTGWEPA